MAKNFKKGLSALLAALMCTGTMSTAAMADTIWQGNDVMLDIAKGEDPYVYAIAQDPANNRWYYETSNHTVKKEVTGGGAVHIFPIVDTTKYSGDWTPAGIYNSGVSNYDVMYCCDAVTGTDNEAYYKRVNLEDSEYVSDTDAKRLRAIVENAYPYVSVKEAKAALEAAGFTQAGELDRSELISATQAAIWTIANPDSGDSYRYNKTATTAQKLTWGGYMHEFAAEITNFTDSTDSRKYLANPNGVGDRVNALIDFYLAMEGVEAEFEQIVISELEIEKTELAEVDGFYNVHLRAELNREVGDADVSFDVYVGGEKVEDLEYELKGQTYTTIVKAEAGKTIKAVVSGTQKLERGVYFYIPEPMDIDGDGIATSREVSQNLIGVGGGDDETPVQAEAEVIVAVNPVTGAVTLKKVDEKYNSLSGAAFELYTEKDGEDICLGSFELSDSTLFIGNLAPGSYWLKETRAPAGFAGLDEEIPFEVTAAGKIYLNYEGELVEVANGESTHVTEDYAVGEAVPVLVLELVPGEYSDADVYETTENNITVGKREATANVGEVETVVNASSTGETVAVAPVYDVIDGVKEDKGGMFDYQFNSGLTSKNSNTETWTNMPADADVRYVGTGEHSKYYVAVAYVEYEKNENGSTAVDENGNYVIKELRKYDDVTSPALTINGEETTKLITELSLESQYDNPGGSRPFMFALMDRNGKPYYGYCCDLDTPTNDGFYYTIGNLEDSNYYGSEEAEAHIRSIAMNGYWGTTGIPDEDGNYAFGSLELLKEKLKAYLAENPELNVELTAPVLDPNNKYQPVVDENGNVVTDTQTMIEMVEGLTDGEALLATQAAFWTHANGSYEVLNGKDGSIVLDPDGYKWNHDAMANSKNAGGYTNGEAMDDFASTAVDFLYTWLINLETDEESTVVINDKNFVENMAIEIGSKAAEGDNDDADVYNAAISFDFDYKVGEADELFVDLTYVDAYGETITLTKRFANEGDNCIDIVNGRYVIGGLVIAENQPVEFTLNMNGTQYLEQGTYVYLAYGARENSQNFVGVMEGEKKVDVSKTVNFDFAVTECKTYTTVPSTIIVENTPEPPEELGTKESNLLDRDSNRFEITIDVPGKDGEQSNEHDEVILMVDGSYSGDTEWPAMKEAINAIGETVLNGSGSTQLTLMAFGMGDNEVLVHVKDADELAAALGELPGNLLRGVSSTNCEAGFTGVDEYIKNHDESLKDAIVLYITDGGINTDETPRLFYYWQDYAPNTNTVINYAVNGVAFEEINGVTKDNSVDFTNELWRAVFEHSKMDIEKAYPISEMERAFLQYDEDNGTTVRYSFLMAMKSSKFDKYPNVWNRTYNSVFDLAKNSKVEDLYLVRYQNDGRATWMPDAAAVSDSDKIQYVKSDSITTLLGALEGTLPELAKTPFNDVVVTDYMSKWVNIDLDTIKIIDNTTGETIWNAVDGWLIDENRPTAQEIPVVVELVDSSEYEAGGEDVIGNENGDIYKLTWYVKDGAMLRADNYRLAYEVTVDTAEEGFEYEVDYPANGNTDLTYTDENGYEQTNKIDVPDVDAEEPEIPTVSFNSGDASNISFMLIDEDGNVEFLYKVDIENETSFEIPAKPGKISAVFIKQSTSGMFWFAEEVDKETQNAVIECLKANNPSYKGHNAIAFGEGEHNLEFKDGKFVTYTFEGGKDVVLEDAEDTIEFVKSEVTEPEVTEPEVTEPEVTEPEVTEPEVTEPEVTEPEVTEPEVTEPEVTEPEVTEPEVTEPEVTEPEVTEPEVTEPEVTEPEVTEPEVTEPEVTEPETLKYSVDGADIAEWIVIDGITAIYIEKDGKVPAVVWTSDKVDDTMYEEIIAEFDADDDAKRIFGIGDLKIEYQHNKNKIKIVTYTFFEIAE